MRLQLLRSHEAGLHLGFRSLRVLSDQGEQTAAAMIFPATMHDMLRGGYIFLKMKECLACRELLHF